METQKRVRDLVACVEQQIRSAQERGAFENLPGVGKPFEIAVNPYAPDQDLSFKLLKDAGYAPDWIELDKAVRARRAAAHATLARAKSWPEERLREIQGRSDVPAIARRDWTMAGWRRAVVAFAEEVTAINDDIAALNLRLPSPRFQRHKLDAQREIEQVEAGSK